MSDKNRCNGVKADGTRCGSTRMSNFSFKPSHLATPTPWYCPAHRNQSTEGTAS